MKLVKVTEFDGFMYQSDDGPQFVADAEDPWKPHVYLTADVLGPDGAVSKSWAEVDRRRGRWRIAIEFEPGDEPVKAPSRPASTCRVWELFDGHVRLYESGTELAEYWDPEDRRWAKGWGPWGSVDMSEEDLARSLEAEAAVDAYRTRPPGG